MSSPSSYHAAIKLLAAEAKRKSAPNRGQSRVSFPPPKQLPARPKSGRKESDDE